MEVIIDINTERLERFEDVVFACQKEALNFLHNTEAKNEVSKQNALLKLVRKCGLEVCREIVYASVMRRLIYEALNAFDDVMYDFNISIIEIGSGSGLGSMILADYWQLRKKHVEIAEVKVIKLSKYPHKANVRTNTEELLSTFYYNTNVSCHTITLPNDDATGDVAGLSTLLNSYSMTTLYIVNDFSGTWDSETYKYIEQSLAHRKKFLLNKYIVLHKNSTHELFEDILERSFVMDADTDDEIDYGSKKWHFFAKTDNLIKGVKYLHEESEKLKPELKGCQLEDGYEEDYTKFDPDESMMEWSETYPLYWTALKANDGDNEAQYLLGKFLLEHNMNEGSYWCTLSANNGNIEAQYLLAKFLLNNKIEGNCCFPCTAIDVQE